MLGVITALPKEYAAVRVMLEDAKDVQIEVGGTTKRFTTGTITSKHDGEKHEIALAVLPIMGTNAAAIAANMMGDAFREKGLEAIIMVGIAGGTPNPNKPEDHVRLGDIVISNDGGVVQYDNIKTVLKAGEPKPRIEIRSHPRPPSAKLLEAVKLFYAEALYKDKEWIKYISEGQTILTGYERPDEKKDILYDYQENAIEHPVDNERISGEPKIHLGKIGSANTLLKNPVLRDDLRDQQGVRAIEMEASGIADATWVAGKEGYLVIRGICDYCDPSKNDEWQNYAALAAAAYFKGLVESIPAKITPRFYAETASESNSDDPVPVEHDRFLSDLFVGREDTINKVIENFDKEDGVYKIAIVEKGGIGKSALAGTIAERYRNRPLSTERFVFVADLKNESASDAALRWLKYFGLNYDNEDESTRLNEVRRHLYRTPSIVILDNCRDRQEAQKLVVHSPNLVYILTSRDKCSVPTEFTFEPIDELDQEISAELIKKFIRDDRKNDTQSIEKICHLCGGIPLALTIAGGSLRNKARWEDLRNYAAKLEEVRMEILSPGENADDSIRATFSISYDDLTEKEKAVFDSLGIFHSNDFCSEAVSAMHQINELANLQRLADLSLITELGANRFGIHDLMMLYAKEKPNDEQVADQWKNRLLRFYGSYLESHKKSYGKIDLERQNIFGLLLQDFPSKSPDLAGYFQIIQNFHPYLKDRGYWNELLRISENAYEVFKNQPIEKAFVATWLLSWIYFQQSNFPEALRIAKESLPLYDQVSDQKGKAAAKRRVGMSLLDMGQLNDAEDWLKQAKVEFELLQMPLKVGDTLCLLAIVERKREIIRKDVAQKYLDDAMKLVEDDEKEKGMILYALGRLNAVTGDAGKAIELHLQSLDIDEKIGRNPGIAYNNFRIGQIEISNTDKKEGALVRLNKAKTIFSSLGNLKRIKQIDEILENNK